MVHFLFQGRKVDILDIVVVGEDNQHLVVVEGDKQNQVVVEGASSLISVCMNVLEAGCSQRLRGLNLCVVVAAKIRW